MLHINQITRLIGSLSVTAVSVYIIKLLSGSLYYFSSYVVINACVGLVALIELGVFNSIGHSLTTWFKNHGDNFRGGFFLVISKVKYRLLAIVIAFLSLMSYKDLCVWWLVLLPLVVYIKRCVQVVEQAAFTDYRYWLRELFFSLVKLLLLFYLNNQYEISHLDVFAVLIFADVFFVFSYLNVLRGSYSRVVVDLEHRSAYRFSFTSNYLSNQAESVFPVFLLSSPQVSTWGVIMPFISLSKQISSSFMGANFAYIQTKKSWKQYVFQSLMMLVAFNVIGVTLAALFRLHVVGVFGNYINDHYTVIVLLTALNFSILMCSSIFGDWLRKLGRMSFIRLTSSISVGYVLSFLVMWLMGVFLSIEIYFIGKLLVAVVVLLYIINEFRKSLYN